MLQGPKKAWDCSTSLNFVGTVLASRKLYNRLLSPRQKINKIKAQHAELTVTRPDLEDEEHVKAQKVKNLGLTASKVESKLVTVSNGV